MSLKGNNSENLHHKSNLGNKNELLTSGSGSFSKSSASLPCEDETDMTSFPSFAPFCDDREPTLVFRG